MLILMTRYSKTKEPCLQLWHYPPRTHARKAIDYGVPCEKETLSNDRVMLVNWVMISSPVFFSLFFFSLLII